MRRVKFYDEETRKHLIFLSNNFHLTANQIAQLYKHRWFIELFFKWIKQHLKIKAFWGHSENAVKTQVWIAVSVYVLVLIAKKKFMLKQSPYEILQILSISIFEKMAVNQLFQQTQLQYFKEQKDNQLKCLINIETLMIKYISKSIFLWLFKFILFNKENYIYVFE